MMMMMVRVIHLVHTEYVLVLMSLVNVYLHVIVKFYLCNGHQIWTSCVVFLLGERLRFAVCILAKDEVIDEAAGQEGGKKKRNRKRNKAKG